MLDKWDRAVRLLATVEAFRVRCDMLETIDALLQRVRTDLAACEYTSLAGRVRRRALEDQIASLQRRREEWS